MHCPLSKIKHSKENWHFGFSIPNPRIQMHCKNPLEHQAQKMQSSGFATEPIRFSPEGSSLVNWSASLS
jgi:hypothetical protein